mgnify:CR=1 FL=1
MNAYIKKDWMLLMKTKNRCAKKSKFPKIERMSLDSNGRLSKQ